MFNEKREISPALAAFGVLIIAFLGVGLYVNQRDIRTEGVTAQQELLPRVIPAEGDEEAQAASDVTVHYPATWEVGNDLTNGFQLHPTDAQNSATSSIEVQVVDQSFDSYAEQLQTENPNADFDTYSNSIDPSLPGRRYSVTLEQSAGEPRVTTDTVVLALPDGRSLRASLKANTNAIDGYRDTFELIVRNLDVRMLQQVEVPARNAVAAPELTNVSDDNGTVVSLTVPADWTSEVLANTSAYGLSVTPDSEESNTDLQVFLLSPELTVLNLGVAEPIAEPTPGAILEAYKAATNPRILQDVTPNTLNEQEGATLLERVPGSASRVTEVGVYPYSDRVWLSYKLNTDAANLASDLATVDAILGTVEYISLLAEMPAPDLANAPALTETTHSEELAITFAYPEGWIPQLSPPSTVFAIQPNEEQPLLVVTAAIGTPQETADLLQIQPEGELTATSILEAFRDRAFAPDMILQPISEYVAGDYHGVSLIALDPAASVPGQRPEAPRLYEFGIVELPDGRLLTFLPTSPVDQFAEARAITQAFIQSIQVGDATSSEETESPDGETPTESPDAEDSQSSSEGEPPNDEGSEDAGSEGDTGAVPSTDAVVRIIG